MRPQLANLKDEVYDGLRRLFFSGKWKVLALDVYC